MIQFVCIWGHHIRSGSAIPFADGAGPFCLFEIRITYRNGHKVFVHGSNPVYMFL